jgi:translation initiation factor IF-1
MESEVKYRNKTMTNSISHGKLRYMVVWIQNHDKFIVLIWKTIDMRFGCKIRINSLHSVTNNAYTNPLQQQDGTIRKQFT